MSKIRLKSLLSTTLLVQFFLYAGEKFLVPLYAPNVIQRMYTIQHYTKKLEDQISVEKLETNPRLSTFLKGVAERAKQHTRVPKPTMIIMASEGTFPWIQNLACSVAGYDMLTRISVITIDHETTLSIGLEFPMMPVCELGFDEFLEIIPPSYERAVRRRLFDILRLRIGALVAKQEMDVLIAAPNQVWTTYLLNRTMYLLGNHQNREGLLVQKLEPYNENSDLIDSSSFIVLGRYNAAGSRILEKLSDSIFKTLELCLKAHPLAVDYANTSQEGLLEEYECDRNEKSARLLTQKYTTADSALTYACDVPERYMCRRLSPERMSGPGWFRGKRKVAPDIVHLPMKTKVSTLSTAGLWLLTEGGLCNASLRENLMLSLLYSTPKWEEGLPAQLELQQLRTRIRPPHPEGHRSFLEESGATDL